MSSTPSQLINQIIQAGAGAGKTTTLINTFIEDVQKFKSSNGRYPRVVVSTFTRKATQELKERLFAKALELQDQELFDYLNKRSWVHISTLHGLLVPFLSRYGSRAGLNPEIKIVSSAIDEKNLKRIIKKAIEKNVDYLDLLENLSWSDLTVGLRKVYEISALDRDFNFDSVAEIKKSCEIDLSHLRQRQKEIAKQFQIHAESEKWKEYAEAFGLSFQDFKELQTWEQNLPNKPRFSPSKPSLDPVLHEDLECFREEVERFLKQPLYNSDLWPDFEKLHRLFKSLSEEVVPAYLKMKLDSGSISMGDLETLTVYVLRENPETGIAFSKEWDFWMVDEYQDTSPVQVFILSHFIQKQPHFVVGDPQQSIYLFRGSRTEVFTEKKNWMMNNGGLFTALKDNYRSRHQLVLFFNELFLRLSDSFVEAYPKADETNDLLPAATLTLIPPDEEDKEFSSEVETVLAQIQDLILDGAKPEEIAILTRKRSLLEEFVQCAKKARVPVQCPSASNYWRRREILDLIGLTHFLLNSHNSLSLLGLFRSPWFFVPDATLMELSSNQSSKYHSLWGRIIEASSRKPELEKPVQDLLALKEKAMSFGVSAALMDFLKNSDFFKYDRFIDPTGRREANIWKFVSDLKTQEKKAGQNLIDSIDSILDAENLDLDQAEQDAPPVIEPNRVTLLTVHASKGLQFKHVFVAGFGSDSQKKKNETFAYDEVDRIFSISPKDEDGKILASPVSQRVKARVNQWEDEESLRVLYVALTRAQSTLWISGFEGGNRNTWIRQLPLDLSEGDHPFTGGFYRVQKLTRVPKIFQEALLNQSQNELKPLQGFEKRPTTLQKVSVTSKVSSGQTKTTGSILSKAKALEKAQFGTLAHKVFESLAVRKGQSFQADDDFKQALDYIYSLQKPNMKEILRVGFAEWGFSVKIDGQILQGSIDLWAELEEAVYILDYKTGSSSYAEKAFEQMKLYSAALQKTGACSLSKPHFLVAIYPFEEKVILQEASQSDQKAQN